MNEFNVALIINDVAMLIDEPARTIYRSPISIHLLAISILQYHGFIFIVMFKIAKALVWIKIKTLHSIRQRKFVFVIGILKLDQILILKYYLESVPWNNISRFLIDQISFFVNR